MTVMHVHADSASLEHHMNVAGPLFPRFAPLIRLLTIDVYGEPSEPVMHRLRLKARELGGATVEVHALHAGFSRFSGTAAQ
jgi:hypothetical protein